MAAFDLPAVDSDATRTSFHRRVIGSLLCRRTSHTDGSQTQMDPQGKFTSDKPRATRGAISDGTYTLDRSQMIAEWVKFEKGRITALDSDKRGGAFLLTCRFRPAGYQTSLGKNGRRRYLVVQHRSDHEEYRRKSDCDSLTVSTPSRSRKARLSSQFKRLCPASFSQ
jgi:hypothetical protein